MTEAIETAEEAPTSKRFCTACRSVRTGTTCPEHDEQLLDLGREDDRELVRMMLRYAVRKTFVVSFFLTIGIFLAGQIVLRHRVDDSMAYTLSLLAGIVPMVVLPWLAKARVRRRWGLLEGDLESGDGRAARAHRIREVVTGVPLWTAIVCIAIHFARARSSAFDAAVSPLALTFSEVRDGHFSVHVLTYALLHASAAHVVGNALGLVVFGIPLQLRVGRGGLLLLLVGGVLLGGIFEPLFSSSDASTELVGISAGVYAWLVAPAVLDPTLRTVAYFRFARIPMPMWLRAVLYVALWSMIAFLTDPRVAVLGHLGGAIAGALLAIPLRFVPASPAYARWREEQERRANAT